MSASEQDRLAGFVLLSVVLGTPACARSAALAMASIAGLLIAAVPGEMGAGPGDTDTATAAAAADAASPDALTSPCGGA